MEEDSKVDEPVSAQKTEHAVHENAVAWIVRLSLKIKKWPTIKRFRQGAQRVVQRQLDVRLEVPHLELKINVFSSFKKSSENYPALENPIMVLNAFWKGHSRCK